jgi:hypothetical protein
MKAHLKKPETDIKILQSGAEPRVTKQAKVLCGTQLAQNAPKNTVKTTL